MKFDFTLTEKKRIEIKSTLKANRTHHFKHDQLLSELYDIRVVSIMLRRSDVGISLGDLIEKINEEYFTHITVHYFPHFFIYNNNFAQYIQNILYEYFRSVNSI